MVKQCKFCGVLIEGFARNTKKYCSNNCKQLAFYARHGKNWGKDLQGVTNSLAQELLDVKPDFTVSHNEEESEKVIQPVSIQSEEMPRAQPEKETEMNFTVNNNVKSDTIKSEPKKEYKWINSRLLEVIDSQRQVSWVEQMFGEPRRYWDENGWCYVRWISVRLRCLMQNILRLSNYRTVDGNTVREISRAFSDMTESIYFKNLPRNYPLFTLIIELRDKFNSMAKYFSGNEISLRLSVKRKGELIATCFMMGDAIEKKGFSELKFTDGIREEIEKEFQAKNPNYKNKNNEDEEDED